MTVSITIKAQPLTPAGYAPFGAVLAADQGGCPSPANQGTARLYSHLASVENLRPETAAQNWKIYRCTPCMDRPVRVMVMEKHAYSTQLFSPLGASGRYLVAVAGGEDRPELTGLRAFIASGKQAITYLPGIWHLPMTVLDQESDMLSLVYEDGSENDCNEFQFAGGEIVQIDTGEK